MLNISASKLVHIYTFVTVTMHICTTIVDLVSNILDFFFSLLHVPLSTSHSHLSLVLSLPHSTNVTNQSHQSHLSPPIFHNKINRKRNQNLATKQTASIPNKLREHLILQISTTIREQLPQPMSSINSFTNLRFWLGFSDHKSSYHVESLQKQSSKILWFLKEIQSV